MEPVRLNAHCQGERLRSALTALAQECQRQHRAGSSPHAVGVLSPGVTVSYDSERSCGHLRGGPIRHQFAPARDISVLRADELPAQAVSIGA